MPEHFLLIDIDGLRPDVFRAALQANCLPNIARLLGGRGLHWGVEMPVLAPAPSITFCSQACLFTGQHPKAHGVVGNQFFDRLGSLKNGVPSFFAFDVGDTLAIDDAVKVFSDGLASDCLQQPTFYEKMAQQGYRSVVAGNMYAKGAEVWIKPSLVKLARFIKGGYLFGMSSADYDRHILERLLAHLHKHGLPNILTMYFLGIDHDSHKYGPHAQADYLMNHVDPMIGELWDAIQTIITRPSWSFKGSRNNKKNKIRPFVSIFSDHGQIAVVPDDSHSLRVGYPFDRRLSRLFDALGLDIHDYPNEDPNCDAVMALNGGTADIYLRHGISKHWPNAPRFESDVLRVGRAFWQAHTSGKYAPELHGALSGVLVRHTARDGYPAPYQALTPNGAVISLEAWFATQPAELYADPIHRLHNRTSMLSGDLLLLSNYEAGYYFGGENAGNHGGLHPEDSYGVLAYGWPDASVTEWEPVQQRITQAIQARCRAEGGRQPSTADMLTGLEAFLSSMSHIEWAENISCL